MNKVTYLLLAFFCYSCTSNSETEIHQNKRNNTIHVREKIKEIEIEDVLIHEYASIYLISDYLLIQDYHSQDKLIHIFDRNDFHYLTSVVDKGEGPGEITNIGHVEANEKERILYVTDHGKQRIFTYELDSLLMNPFYKPKERMKMQEGLFPARYKYIHDTLCIGHIIEPIPYVGFAQSTAKWNMNTGEIRTLPYTHPEIERKRVWTDASTEHGIIVECYSYHDLITFYNLDGELIRNLYGRHWNNQTSNRTSYFGQVFFCKDRIITSYLGGDTFIEEPGKTPVSNNPTKFMVFDLRGNYLQTLETGYKIFGFCYDEVNHRLIMNLNDEMQFAYLDLGGI